MTESKGILLGHQVIFLPPLIAFILWLVSLQCFLGSGLNSELKHVLQYQHNRVWVCQKAEHIRWFTCHIHKRLGTCACKHETAS